MYQSFGNTSYNIGLDSKPGLAGCHLVLPFLLGDSTLSLFLFVLFVGRNSKWLRIYWNSNNDRYIIGNEGSEVHLISLGNNGGVIVNRKEIVRTLIYTRSPI